MRKSTGYIICVFGFISLCFAVYFASYSYSLKHMTSDNIITTKEGTETENTIKTGTDIKKVINQKTSFVLQDYNMTKDVIKEYQYTVPFEFMGMTREELEVYMKEYVKQLPESEKKILDYKLISFENDKVVIRKSYQTTSDSQYPFYLKESGGNVIVYEADQNTVYLRTDIPVDVLPEKDQEEIKQGKCIKSNQELFYYLESYTS